MALFALALALVIAVWGAHLLWQLGMWIAVLVTAVVVCGLAYLCWRRYWRRRPVRRTDGLKERDVGPGSAHSAATRRELEQAMRRLQAVEREASGPRPPRFLVLGSRESGKAELLSASGLGLEPLAGSAASHDLPEWHVCTRAAFIELPASVLESDALGDGAPLSGGALSTPDCWAALLDVLKRSGPKAPLDGVVLALEASQALRGPDGSKLGAVMRARLQEVAERLGFVVPVYLAVTKLEELPGFAAFWADLTPQHRRRVWGATLDRATGQSPERVKAELGLLSEILRSRAVFRLAAEPRVEERVQVLRFPEEFEALRSGILRFVAELVKPGVSREVLPIRGLFLTAMDGGAEGRGLAPVGATQALGTARDAPGYFVGDAFSQMVASSAPAVRTGRGAADLRWRYAVVLGGALTAAVAIAGPAVVAFVTNAQLIDEVAAELGQVPVGGVSQAEWALRNWSIRPATQAASALRARLTELSSLGGIRGWWGAYTAPALADVVRARYQSGLAAIGGEALQPLLAADLQTVSQAELQRGESFAVGYDTLRLYLMLTEPSRLERPWADEKVAVLWGRALGRERLVGADLGGLGSDYAGGVSSGALGPWQRDAQAVLRVRERLREVPLGDLAYERLVEASKDVPAIVPSQFLYGPAASVLSAPSRVQVPGVYTLAGQDRTFAALLEQGSARYEEWVLGPPAPPGVERLREQYFDRYRAAWYDLLLGLLVSHPAGLQRAIEQLGLVAAPDGAYGRLFKTVHTNIRARKTVVSQAKKVVAKLAAELDAGVPAALLPEPTLPEELFEGLVSFSDLGVPHSGISQYLQTVAALEMSLRRAQSSSEHPASEMLPEVQQAIVNVSALLRKELRGGALLAVETLLLEPLRQVEGALRGSDRSELNSLWREQVMPEYGAMKSRYPFARESTFGIPQADFAKFFGPQGVIWRFYDEHLQGRVQRSGECFQGQGFSKPFLACLCEAQKIREAFFEASGASPQVTFQVKMQAPGHNVGVTALSVGGQTLEYRNGPEQWQTVRWPGEDSSLGARLRIVAGGGVAHDLAYEGDFGLFRLFDEAERQPLARHSVEFRATWQLGGVDVTMLVRPTASRHPLKASFFEHFRCPQTMLAGGR